MTRDEIVAEARTWLGPPAVRFRMRGRSRNGVDCVGMVEQIGLHFEVPHEDVLDYEDFPNHERLMMRTFDRFLLRAPPRSLYPGTVGVFAGGILPVHAGIFTERSGRIHIVHARLDTRKVIEQEYRPQDTVARLVARFMFPGMEDG